MSLRIHLKRQARDLEVDPLGIRRFAKAVLRGQQVAEGSLTIVLTDDAGIRRLNQRFRRQDRATDVLSFPLNEEDENGVYLGDVVISVERAKTQAPRFLNDPETELARLLVHGILHILGHDHHTPSDGKRMKQAERRALAEFCPGSLLLGGEEGRV